jgi:hypothetical protein
MNSQKSHTLDPKVQVNIFRLVKDPAKQAYLSFKTD